MLRLNGASGFLLYGVVQCIYFRVSCVRLSFPPLFIRSRGTADQRQSIGPPALPFLTSLTATAKKNEGSRDVGCPHFLSLVSHQEPGHCTKNEGDL